MRRVFPKALIVVCLALVAGCRRGPARVAPPEIDPQAAAAQAHSLYDANRDGSLDVQELKACPGVLSKVKEYDVNGDGVVSPEEFEMRLGDLLRHGVALTQLKCKISLRGRPLPGARVLFEPEPYLGTEVQAAEGTTDAEGSAQMGIPAQFVPEDLQRIRVVHYGTFKVRITHPQIEVPAMYNTQTELGYETESGNPFVAFELNKG